MDSSTRGQAGDWIERLTGPATWAAAAHLDHLQDGCSRAGAEVDRDAADVGRAEELVQRGHVALGQVHDVDVVAHARAVARRIVAPEHAQRRALAKRHLIRSSLLLLLPFLCIFILLYFPCYCIYNCYENSKLYYY